jgi:hypothetical protein
MMNLPMPDAKPASMGALTNPMTVSGSFLNASMKLFFKV